MPSIGSRGKIWQLFSAADMSHHDSTSPAASGRARWFSPLSWTAAATITKATALTAGVTPWRTLFAMKIVKVWLAPIEK